MVRQFHRFLLTLATITPLTSCTGLFFYPSRTFVRTPADVGMAFERVEIAAENQPTLVGWFLPAKHPPRGTILFLHGNAENISTHLYAVHWLPSEGYQVFIFDYQGYGESEGQASADNLYADSIRALHYLQSRRDVDQSRLFLVGQSIGASLALYFAAQPEFSKTFRAVIADSPFSGYRDIARDKLASVWLGYLLQWPLGFLVDDSYSPNKVISAIQVPVLFLHGSNDNVVPPEHTERLCSQLGSRCKRWVAEGAVHGQALVLPEYRSRIIQFLDNPDL